MKATALSQVVKCPLTDITVYGATSFSAKHVLSYLLRSSIHVVVPNEPPNNKKPSSLKITLAGRNESKLKDIKYQLSETMNNLLQAQTNVDTGRAEFDVFVAEASHVDEIRSMAARTKIILNCAGPFAKYGTEVVAACAEFGTDYVDITGEVAWASQIREKYSLVSKGSGSRIVSFCGFDTIPSDLAVLAAVDALRTKAGQDTQVDKATTWHAQQGSANAGTVHTLLATPVSWWDCLTRRPVPFFFADPLALAHPTVRKDPSMNPIRNRLALAEWWNQIPQFHSFLIGGASGPFPMAAINAKVIHESALTLKYAKPETFVYLERFLPVGFPDSLRFKALSVIPVLIVQVATLIFLLVLSLPVIGPWAVNTFFPLGSGMSDESCQAGFAHVYAEVESSIPDGKGGQRTKVNKANCFLKFEGDPANWVTAQCVSEAALCLLLDRAKLPPKSEDGFGSPAEILGQPLLQRLTTSKIRPVQYTVNVRIATDKREWCIFD